MDSNNLTTEFGRTIKPKELAEFLDIDVRTVKKYYYMWGGVPVTPSDYRFFEKLVKETIENANPHNETWQATVESRRHFQQKTNRTPVSGSIETKPDRGYPVGTGRGRTSENRSHGKPTPDTHGLFSNHG